MHTRKWTPVLLAIVVGFAVPMTLQQYSPLDAQGAAQASLSRAELQLVSAASLAAAPELSGAEIEALIQRKLEIRERTAQRNAQVPGAAEALAPGGPEVQASEAPATQFHPSESAFFFLRNFLNPRANVAPKASVLAEPTVASNGRFVFAAGNFSHAEFSGNGGATWTDRPLPAGPANAPILCCDQDTQYDDSRRVLLHSYLYINASVTDSAIAIDVRRKLSGPINCHFLLNPAGNQLLDFPHIGLTEGFLWLTSNTIGGGTQNAQMFKFPLAPIVDCAGSVSGSVFSWNFAIEGQKVWRPYQGTNTRDEMFWSHNRNTTELRIFTWADGAAAPVNTLRTVSAWSNVDPDCRGGVNNTDYVGFINVGLFGFNHVGAAGQERLYTYWSAGGPPQAHVRAAVHQLVGTTGTPAIGGLLAQPHLFNSGNCIAFPEVTASKKGHIGFVLAFGGRAGGGTIAVGPAAGIADEFTSIGNPLIVFFFAAATHNPANGRYGDYLDVAPQEPCEKAFVGIGYSLNGGTALANINSRYVEFSRGRHLRCARDYFNHAPNAR